MGDGCCFVLDDCLSCVEWFELKWFEDEEDLEDLWILVYFVLWDVVEEMFC